jgi:formylglycine-generating enzyme required for sulfatase activity
MGTNEQEPYSIEGPRHEVVLSKGFWIGCAPITSRQWNSIMKINMVETSDPGMNALPARGMSWGRAMEFCGELTNRLREAKLLDHCWRITLPTEAQWEYACRAGTDLPWFFGTDASMLSDYAWYHANSGDNIQPVQVKRPNPWGIHDLYGNVMEWCLDHSYLYGALQDTDPCHFDPDGLLKIVRGGSCVDVASECRSASRVFMHTSNPHGEDTGVRIVCIPQMECAEAPKPSAKHGPSRALHGKQVWKQGSGLVLCPGLR